jgi:hypothetical protein
MDIVLATNDARWGVLDAAGVYHWPIYDLNEQGYMREAVEPLFIGDVRADGSRLFVIPSKVWSGAGYVPVLPDSVVEQAEAEPDFKELVETVTEQVASADLATDAAVDILTARIVEEFYGEPSAEVASEPEPEPPPAPKKSKGKKA